MKVVSSSNEELSTIIEEVIDNKEPIEITSAKGNVVMISKEEWSGIQETLYLLSIPGMRESIIEGEKETIEECMDEKNLAWNIDES